MTVEAGSREIYDRAQLGILCQRLGREFEQSLRWLGGLSARINAIPIELVTQEQRSMLEILLASKLSALQSQAETLATESVISTEQYHALKAELTAIDNLGNQLENAIRQYKA